MKSLSLRTRVAAAVAITCIAVVGALALTLYTASEDLEETLVDQIVGEEMDFLIRHDLEHPDVARPPGPNLQYYVIRNSGDLLRVPEGLRSLSSGTHEIGSGINEQHVAVREIGGTRYIVAYDAGPHEVREQQFKNLVLLALGTIMVVAALLGYWVAGLITRQITELSSGVAKLDPGVTHAPLTKKGQDPEVAALAGALDQYQERILELLEHEKEFTGNASHELRTPLTAIVTSCELLESDPELHDRARTRITAIAAAAKRMTRQIEMLLFLARAQAVEVPETAALAELVNDAMEPLRSELERKRLGFHNEIAPDATVVVNYQALSVVVTNILRNAIQYTMHGDIRVQWQSPILVISDSGPGIPAGQRPLLFARHYRGSKVGDGFGLGLAIVKRVCDHCGWMVEVADAPGGGTSLRITLA